MEKAKSRDHTFFKRMSAGCEVYLTDAVGHPRVCHFILSTEKVTGGGPGSLSVQSSVALFYERDIQETIASQRPHTPGSTVSERPNVFFVQPERRDSVTPLLLSSNQCLTATVYFLLPKSCPAQVFLNISIKDTAEPMLLRFV